MGHLSRHKKTTSICFLLLLLIIKIRFLSSGKSSTICFHLPTEIITLKFRKTTCYLVFTPAEYRECLLHLWILCMFLSYYDRLRTKITQRLTSTILHEFALTSGGLKNQCSCDSAANSKIYM